MLIKCELFFVKHSILHLLSIKPLASSQGRVGRRRWFQVLLCARETYHEVILELLFLRATADSWHVNENPNSGPLDEAKCLKSERAGRTTSTALCFCKPFIGQLVEAEIQAHSRLNKRPHKKDPFCRGESKTRCLGFSLGHYLLLFVAAYLKFFPLNTYCPLL